MKKLKWVALLGMVLIFGACNKTPKEEFISVFHSLHKQGDNVITFEASIKDLDMKSLSNEEWEREFTEEFRALTIYGQESLKATKTKGTYHYDEEENANLLIQIEALDEKIPIELIVKKNTYWYLSTSYIESTSNIINKFSAQTEITQDELKEVEGKFIDLEKHLRNYSHINSIPPNGKRRTEEEISKEEIRQVEKMLDPAQNWKVINQLLKNGKDSSFSKDDDTLTYQFTKQDLEKIQLFEYFIDNPNELKFMLEQINVTMTIDSKTRETHCFITLNVPEAYTSMTIDLAIESNKNSQPVSLPLEQEIISKNDL